MTYRSLTQKPLGKAVYGAFLFALLMLARDTLVTSCLVGFTRSQLLGLALICLLGLSFLVQNRRQWKQILTDRRIGLMVLSAALLLLPMVLKRDWQLMYFSILICLLFPVFLTYFTDVRETARYYVVIFTALCIHSLVSLLILKSLAMAGKISPPIFYNSNEWDFYNFGLSYVVTWPTWYRNFGIFREPGVYQFFILLGMYLNNYHADWKKGYTPWLVNAVLVATMISTFAVGGFIETALFAVFLYVDKKWYKTARGRLLALAIVALGAAAVAYVVIQIRKPGSEGTAWFNFTDIYLRLFTKSDSLVDRVSAILTNLKLFLDKPLLGDTIANVLHGTNHNTSSTLILYAVLGVLGGSLNVAAWAALAWERDRSIFGNCFLLLILFMSFNTQNLVADVFFWLFPYMALTQWAVTRRRRA